MNAPLPTESTEDPAARAQTLLLRQVERLDALAEEGLQMARLIREQVSADPAAAPAGAVTAFARVAKAVRLCGLVQERLVKAMEDARRSALIYAPMAQAAALAEARERVTADPAEAHKARVERIVERQVRARHKDEQQVERLMVEACDRLDDEDLYRDVQTRPLGELVARICRDLGLNPDWERLSQEAWAQEEIASGVEGSPFKSLDAARPPPFSAETRGENDRQGRLIEPPSADPGAKPGEEPMVVGESRFPPPDRSPETHFRPTG